MKNPKDLVKTLSVSVASLVLLLGRRSEAEPPQPSTTPTLKDGQKQSQEPLVLTPSSVETQLFAGHTSHASHVSHYSGSGGDAGGDNSPYVPYTPPTTVPTPAPTPYSPPSYPQATPYVPRATPPAATPVPTPAPTPTATPADLIKIEFTNGATLIGTVLSKSPEGIIFAATNGKNYKIAKELLSAATLAELKLPSK